MMKLYFSPGTIAVAVAIALHEADLPFDPVRVDFASGAQMQPEYLALNPKGRVPALVTTDGTIMTETGALLEYIAALKPETELVPTAPQDAAHMRAVMYYLASTMHVAHAHKMRGTRWADTQAAFDDMKAKVPQTMTDCATYVENECLRGDYVLGASFSAADAYLFVACSWLAGDGVDVAQFPKITAFSERMEARASVKAVRASGIL